MRSPRRVAHHPAAALLPAATLGALLLNGCAGHPPAEPGHAGIVQAAQRQADSTADPVAAKLAVWLRALTPGAASAGEIDAFLRANPDWPGRAILAARLQQALAVEPDDAAARTLCEAHPPDTAASLLRCAQALSAAAPGAGGSAPTTSPPGFLAPDALPAAIRADADTAWIAGMDDPTQEAEFLRLFGGVPGPAEQWRRFDRQEWAGSLAAARRQLGRLAAADRPLAEARLALHQNAPGAETQAAGLRGPAARDPALLLDLARWLRRQNRDDEALALWHGRALDAEATAAASRRAAFWSERAALARDLLDQRRDPDALFLAEDAWQGEPAARLDSAFLAGWIELRRLHAPEAASGHFSALASESRSVITTSRGYFWLGEALAAQNRAGEARAAYGQAALRPTSFYGQAALRLLFPGDAAALAASLRQARDPDWTEAEAIRFAGLELARAATLLVAWNDAHHARAFLLRLDEQADSDRDHALGAAFADRLGLPDVAVAIARSAGRRGLVLPQSGWPAPFAPPPQPALPAGLALAVMRQESSFDPAITSPAGAHGLMQLMPGTARTLSGGSVGVAELSDPRTNLALGTRYLAELLQQFGGSVPMAVAAFNAGPSRARQWWQLHGAPTDAEQVIDWIELIPFAETRNYVQRVLESQAVYAARSAAPDLSHLAGGAADP